MKKGILVHYIDTTYIGNQNIDQYITDVMDSILPPNTEDDGPLNQWQHLF
jgi:hypothetical protein